MNFKLHTQSSLKPLVTRDGGRSEEDSINGSRLATRHVWTNKWSKKWKMWIANKKCLLVLIYNACWKTIPHKYYSMNNDSLPLM